MIELAEPDRLSSGSWAALLGRLPQQPGNTGDAPRLFGWRVQGDAIADLTVEHPCDRKLAAMGGVEGFQYDGDRFAIGFNAKPFRGRRNAGCLVTQRLQQAQHT